MDWSEAQPFRPACLIYSCKSRASCLKSHPPYAQPSQILYHTVSQHISPLLSVGGRGGSYRRLLLTRKKQAIRPSGSPGERGPGVSKKDMEDERGEEECCLAPVPRRTMLRCIFPCCRLLKNVSWPPLPDTGRCYQPCLALSTVTSPKAQYYLFTIRILITLCFSYVQGYPVGFLGRGGWG